MVDNTDGIFMSCTRHRGGGTARHGIHTVEGMEIFLDIVLSELFFRFSFPGWWCGMAINFLSIFWLRLWIFGIWCVVDFTMRLVGAGERGDGRGLLRKAVFETWVRRLGAIEPRGMTCVCVCVRIRRRVCFCLKAPNKSGNSDGSEWHRKSSMKGFQIRCGVWNGCIKGH